MRISIFVTDPPATTICFDAGKDSKSLWRYNAVVTGEWLHVPVGQEDETYPSDLPLPPRPAAARFATSRRWALLSKSRSLWSNRLEIITTWTDLLRSNQSSSCVFNSTLTETNTQQTHVSTGAELVNYRWQPPTHQQASNGTRPRATRSGGQGGSVLPSLAHPLTPLE